MWQDPKELAEIGRTLVAARRYAEARKLYDRALALAPDDVRCLDVLGFLAYMTGAFADARGYCDRSLALAPDNAYAMKGLGLCLVRLGDPEGGIAALTRAVALDPEGFDAHHDLGATWLELRRYPEARAAFERARALADSPARAEAVARALRKVAAEEAGAADRGQTVTKAPGFDP